MKVAIIGTRNPDGAQQQAAAWVSETFSKAGHDVSTGAADGIDTVAMTHCVRGRLQLFLPWASYGARVSGAQITVYSPGVHQAWTDSVRRYHPNPDALTRGAFALHARNYGIVEGCGLVIAFPGEKDGGTGQGIRIALALGIPLIVCRKGQTTNDLAVAIRDFHLLDYL